MSPEPYTHCPQCGEADLVITADRVHDLQGFTIDDASEQLGTVGSLVCGACSAGDLWHSPFADRARVTATLDQAAEAADRRARPRRR